MCNLAALDDDQLYRLRDAVNMQLLGRRRTAGLQLNELLSLLEEVKVALRDQGKEWRSLERWQYIDGQICFWLNPTDQSRYQIGWFSIDDLIRWAHDAGPVVIGADGGAGLGWQEELAYDLAA